MHSRRTFLVGTASTAAVMQFSGCGGDAAAEYERTQASLRSSMAANPDVLGLIRFATLAPSGHNTQPWRFLPSDSGMGIVPDLSRRTAVVDPDDHHLFVSLGCAAENLLIAAAAHGRPGEMEVSVGSEDRIDVRLARGAVEAGALYGAIVENQSTRSAFDGKPVAAESLRLLSTAARVPGVSMLLLTESRKREDVLEFVLRGNDEQMGNAGFVAELLNWIRFNPAEALKTGDGLFTRCSGQTVIPTWIGRAGFRQFYRKDSEDARYVQQMRSSAGVAIFAGEKADKAHWVQVGRSFQRFALQATALGIRHSLVNQPVEVPAVRDEFARFLGLGGVRPDLVVRFGYAPLMPMSMRRPVSSVIGVQDAAERERPG